MFKEYRPAISAFLLMMAMALTSTALSFFITPVCTELGLGRGAFTVYYSLMTAAGVVSISFIGQLVNKRGVRSILLVSAVLVAAGLTGFSLAKNLWTFYIVAFVMGLAGSSCVCLCANVIVQQSYSGGKASGLLGIVMAGSGVGGMVVSSVLPGLLDRFGWRMGYRILAVCWLVLVVAAWFLVGKQETGNSVGQRRTPIDGMSRAEALKSPKLYLICIVSFIVSAACGIQQQLPSLLEGYGFDSGSVGAMLTFFTGSLAVGKILQGLFYGKVGPRIGGVVMLLVFAGSYVLLCSPGLVYPALVGLAFGMGAATTLLPTITRFTFGAREYAAIWSIVTTASSVGSLAANPLFGMVYDVCRSYAPAMIASTVLLILAAGALVLTFKKSK